MGHCFPGRGHPSILNVSYPNSLSRTPKHPQQVRSDVRIGWGLSSGCGRGRCGFILFSYFILIIFPIVFGLSYYLDPNGDPNDPLSTPNWKLFFVAVQKRELELKNESKLDGIQCLLWSLTVHRSAFIT